MQTTATDALWDTKQWGRQHKGERKMLAERLTPGETVLAAVQGTFAPDMGQYKGLSTTAHRGIAVLTNQRVMMLDKGIFSSEFASVPLASIESITDSSGMIFGGVGIQCRGLSSYKLEMISPKSDAAAFANAVREELARSSQ